MQFKYWFENNSPKNLLLLIHPDCVSELGLENCKKYEQKLIQHAPKFDHIISHYFFWKNTIESRRDSLEKDALISVVDTVKKISNITTDQTGPSSCTYNSELPDYLINNENITIFMAGGYEDNCLWRAYIELFKKLDWLIKEKNITVKWYEPLIFQTSGLGRDKNYPEPSEEDIEMDRKNIKNIDGRPITFHPKKVDYGSI